VWHRKPPEQAAFGTETQNGSFAIGARDLTIHERPSMKTIRTQEPANDSRDKEQFDQAKQAMIGEVFDRAATRRSVEALIAIAQDPENSQCVRAARLLFEFTYGRPRQMIVDAGEERYRAYLEQIRRAVLGDTTADAGRSKVRQPRRRGLRSASDPGTDPSRE
jgi:hypothetical protein